MTARQAVLGLCAICAVSLSAVAAPSAMAVSQTAVECTTTGTQTGTTKFSDEHCKVENAAGPRYHVAIPAATAVATEWTNLTTGSEREPAKLKATIASLETIIEAKKYRASGTIENKLSGTEMYVEGLTNAVVLEEVTVTNRACEFVGINPSGAKTFSKIETQPVRGTTKEQLAGTIKFEPQAGSSSKFGEFELSGASCPAALKGLYPVFGVIISNKTEGATDPFKHTTVTSEPAPQLRLKSATGPLAGIEGKITIKKTSGGVPIALT